MFGKEQIAMQSPSGSAVMSVIKAMSLQFIQLHHVPILILGYSMCEKGSSADEIRIMQVASYSHNSGLCHTLPLWLTTHCVAAHVTPNGNADRYCDSDGRVGSVLS